MLELEWDEELAWLAQAHADTCSFGHDCNACRRWRQYTIHTSIEMFTTPGCRLSRWRSVGQNLYQSHRSRSGPTNWKAALDAWFWDEINLFPVSSVYR